MGGTTSASSLNKSGKVELATPAAQKMPEAKKLRSEEWFNNPDNPGMTAIYVERYLNFGLTLKELQSGRPVIGIAQTGSDLAPCNRVHLETAERAAAGIRDAGGVPLIFPVHPIQESCRRPTASLDRNLAYLGLVEILHGYPFDGVVLTTACDKTTPALLMAAATTDLPAIVLSGGPMLDGWHEGELAGSGTMVWEGRKACAEGKITYEKFMEQVAASTPSVGHCNTMGTALSMNSLAEALGMSPGQVSSLVERLRSRDLLESNRSTSDRRRRLWRLTSAGRDCLADAGRVLAERAGDLNRHLNPSEQDLLRDLLQRVASTNHNASTGRK